MKKVIILITLLIYGMGNAQILNPVKWATSVERLSGTEYELTSTATIEPGWHEPTSKSIEKKILEGCLMERPGWIRMSIHPTMTNAEVEFICHAIKEVATNFKTWEEDYSYNAIKNEFIHKSNVSVEKEITKGWF